MRRVEFDRYGEAAAMRMGDGEVPPPKPGQVRVRVKAAALNPLDWKQRKGDLKLFMNRRFPKGMGSDFAGVVEAVGEGVPELRIGDEVFGTMDIRTPGAFAEVLVTEARHVVRKPPQLSFAEAACLPIPATTAWAAILDKGHVSRNSRVLINGCTGAVGSMAVQLARARQAQVAGTCSRASFQDALAAGVNTVIDYADESQWRQAGPFDVIFDTAGTLDLRRGMSLLRPDGVFIDINPTPAKVLRGMLTRRYKIVFATMGMKHLADIAEWAAQGKLRSTIGRERPFSEAVETIASAESGARVPGRVVLNF
jgi:NADPH:quinone reductase-like Zn-dependent oxidoreductase